MDFESPQQGYHYSPYSNSRPTQTSGYRGDRDCGPFAHSSRGPPSPAIRGPTQLPTTNPWRSSAPSTSTVGSYREYQSNLRDPIPRAAYPGFNRTPVKAAVTPLPSSAYPVYPSFDRFDLGTVTPTRAAWVPQVASTTPRGRARTRSTPLHARATTMPSRAVPVVSQRHYPQYEESNKAEQTAFTPAPLLRRSSTTPTPQAANLMMPPPPLPFPRRSLHIVPPPPPPRSTAAFGTAASSPKSLSGITLPPLLGHAPDSTTWSPPRKQQQAAKLPSLREVGLFPSTEDSMMYREPGSPPSSATSSTFPNRQRSLSSATSVDSTVTIGTPRSSPLSFDLSLEPSDAVQYKSGGTWRDGYGFSLSGMEESRKQIAEGAEGQQGEGRTGSA